ncbi:DUF305 domain-containing protein [Nocardioides bizhenqiangii]|uniref:DUF305 domain-containing protein n=1 Tax=Nocardioides bizhenqiangii TaxID=3095076 RepID=A0ABZ0ZUA3_9ACTN|nr:MULTISPECIES: DUF305 domain-containing protein [unclassified Nocardioides]MDZ5623326.1 DUF305 domain-containing protein [Nocardioides sp. HM23]WQQ27645.1 DUF305 domain-containing protein [Nocardioides sp. HM61]
MRTTLRLLAAASAAALALSGCTSDGDDSEPESDSPVVQLGAPGETNRTLSPEEVEGLDQPEHTEADVAFVQNMLPHHQQALTMTAMVDERSASRKVGLLAERIEISQTDEIAQMEGWLTERDEALPGEHAHHGGHAELMPGMLTGPELAQLRAARGERFDRLFLNYMIRHHEGAVIMVEDLLTGEDGGQEPEVFQLARHIESDQLVEIARMKRMLVDGSS